MTGPSWRRSGRVSIVVAFLMLLGGLGSPAFAGDGPVQCNPNIDPGCIITVTGPGNPGSPGQPGHPGPTPSPGQGDGVCHNTNPDTGCVPCPTADPQGVDPGQAGDPAACAAWQHTLGCRTQKSNYMLGAFGTTDADALTAAQVAQLNTYLAAQGCPTVTTPATLAQQAVAMLRLPKPSGHRSPGETQLYKGVPFTWVNLWTMFWSDPDTWKPVSATAATPDGSVWATATATPVSLTYTPGDGHAPIVCDGPGRPWVTSDGFAAPSQGACGYQYTDISQQPLTSTQTITWDISWVGSGGTSGTITPPLTTSTSGQLNVMQIETVIK